ncbi:NAD-binding protein [Aminithiophilus ramosus]|uniref:Glutamyl-tRNA reductase n=1 Tax=Aminithiophilus ramosus TaxID=3029084 RepID=A0A9Q7ADY0_9BACT|nr:NAD-binding protein [Aminithiophilus ramosus]QTX32988.1 NAD-binding protein [Aminithiophilus ramosus]
MRLLCLSFDHRSSSAALRADQAQFWAGTEPDGGLFFECLTLFTCNRFELFAVPGPLWESDAPSLPPEGHLLQGGDVVRHLLRLLLGLESLALGEEQIVGQFRRAYDEGKKGCGPVLHHLCQHGLSLASTLRSRYHPGRAPSTASLMVDRFEEKEGKSRRVLVIGCGRIGIETARILKGRGHDVTLVNRTESKGLEASVSLGLPLLPWSRLHEKAATAEALFVCTSSPQPLPDIPPRGFRGSLFDLGATPQVSPSAGRDLVNLDDMASERDRLLGDYGRLLLRLEGEAQEAAEKLWREMEDRRGDVYRRLALARARDVALSRAAKTARRQGWDEKVLEELAWSVVKGVLHPLLEDKGAHAGRAWKLLAREERE